MIFRLSRPVSCKNQENGSGKQWSLHAPLNSQRKDQFGSLTQCFTTQWVPVGRSSADDRPTAGDLLGRETPVPCKRQKLVLSLIVTALLCVYHWRLSTVCSEDLHLHVYRSLIIKLNSTERGGLFRHFCVSKVITTEHVHKTGVVFHIFLRALKQKKSRLYDQKWLK